MPGDVDNVHSQCIPMGDTLFNPKQCFTRCFVVISVVIIFQISPGCVKLNHAGGDCIEPKKKMNDIFANKTNAILAQVVQIFHPSL